MNTIKNHRMVLARCGFNRIANLESGAAMECAENEGWPIEAAGQEFPHAEANAGAIALARRLPGGYVEDFIHLRSGWDPGWLSRSMRITRSPRKRWLIALTQGIRRSGSSVVDCP